MTARKNTSNDQLAIPDSLPNQNAHPAIGFYGYTNQSQPLSDFVKVIVRRKTLVLNTFFLVVALGVALTMMTKPVYLTAARILVQGKTSLFTITNTQDPLNNLFLPDAGYDVNTQVELLRSPLILDKAYKASGLTSGAVTMDARQIGTTDIIEITSTSNSRENAEKFATVLPEVYLKSLKESRMSELNSALDFASRRLRESTDDLNRSTLELQRYKQTSGIAGGEEERTKEFEASVAAQSSVTEGNSEITRLQAQLAGLIAARSQLPTVVEDATTTTNPEIAVMKARITEMQIKRNDALLLYKPGTDQINMIDSQIASLQNSLARLPPTVTTKSQSANSEVAAMDAKINDTRISLQAAISGLKVVSARAATLQAKVSNYNPAERVVDQLIREIAASQSAVDSFTKSVQDLTLRQRAAQAKNNPVTIVAAAGRATQIAPDVKRNLLMAILLAIVVACGAAMLQEVLDDHIRDEGDVRRLLGVPILGHVPLIELAGGQRPLLTAARPNSQLLESYRVLRSNVGFTMVSGPHRTLLVTSTVPEEGKSSTAANLAIAMAMDNRRIVLVDADLRRPQVGLMFGLPTGPGLTQVLVGQASLEEALQQTEISSLRVLTAGALPPNPAELLNSSAMHEMVEKLKLTTDTIIFDSPPCLATADAQVLSSQVDGVVYVMELGNVRKSSVLRSLELLDQARAPMLGILFNKVEESSDRYYGYAYYNKYYHNDGLLENETKPEMQEPRVAAKVPPSRNTHEAGLELQEPSPNGLPDEHRGDYQEGERI